MDAHTRNVNVSNGMSICLDVSMFITEFQYFLSAGDMSLAYFLHSYNDFAMVLMLMD